MARATHVAGLAETVLGRPVAISEGGAAQPVGREMLAMASKADMSFEPGEHTIGATLTVTFALGDE